MDEVARGTAAVSWKYRVRGGFLHLRAVERAIRASDGFVCPTQIAAERALRAGWIRDPSNAAVTGWGITREALEVVRDPAKPWEGRVVWCGTTVERKGWRYFVAGVTAAMRDQHLTLDVLGTRRESASVLADFAADVRERIGVHSTMSRIEQFACMARGDVFVSASLSEGYHLALQEAMALGLPCIATRAGFLADVTSPGLYAEIPHRSSAAVYHALGRIARDDTHRAQLARNSRAFGQDRTWDNVGTQTAEWLRVRLHGLSRFGVDGR
jgi:glycosyltransferase involved in cell wall biosynthesis